MAVKTKNNAKANYIPANQKHQVISLDQFGAYDYNKRRKQWHKLAGNNEVQEICSICRDDDNWTSVKLDNGNHVCYFCWVKKPTEEAKKAAATVVSKNLKTQNKLVVSDNKKKSNLDAEIVEIQKFNDNQGTSYRNKDDVQNYRTTKNTIDKTSKYGVNPSVYYDSQVDYSKPHDEINVVRPYDKKYLPKASKNAEKKARDLADEAIREYNNAVTRAKLVTKKNMAIAKVEALRTLTKAMVIEKNYYERENEIARHQEAIKNIKKLREQLLEKNEVSLEYNLEKLARDNEIELKNNEDDYIKTKIKIEQKAEIIDLKHRQEKEKIRILSRGEDYKKSSIKNEIKQVKNAKYIPQNVDLDSNDDTLAGLIRRVNQIDPSKLSSEERESVSKFLRLVAAYDRENKHQELLAEYKKAIDDMDKKINKTMKKNSKSKKGNEAMIVSYESYKKVINAKKTSLFISEPIKNYEQPEVRTKVIKVKTNSKAMNPSSKTLVKYKPITNGLNKMDYQKVDISSYYDSDIEKTIKKFKRIAQDANRYDDFFVSKHGDSAYKINYEKIKYTKYELRWRHKHKASNDEGYDVVYKDLYDDDGEKWWSKFTPKKNANGEIIPRSYYTLLRKIDHLPSDPLVVENIDITKKERDDIMNEINTLRNMDISPNLTDSQYRDLIKRVDDVTEIYRYLEQKDLKHRKNVMKAQICDEKLSQRIIRDESRIAHAYARADERYNNREQHINEKYAKNVEYAKNEALLNVERIYENEQESLAREQEQHLWNKASSYEANNKLANDQYKYQNSIIGATVKEIEKFNKKSDTPIVLSDMPHKILPLPVTSNSTININVDKTGSKVMVYSNSSDRRNESAAKAVNDEVPTNVTKIYVLDKFRNVKDVKTRIALLNEHANREYAKAAEYNIVREKREIENADRKLQQKLKVVDEIYQDSTTLKFVGERMNHIVKERDWVQDHYEKVKAEKWKIHDRDQRLKEKIQKMNEKNQELELIKAQKEANRNKEKLRLTSKKDDELDYQDIIAKK